MADDQSQNKTEEPTPRKLEKALEEGQVATSADFTTGVMLLVAALFFVFIGPWLGRQLLLALRQNIIAIHQPEMDSQSASSMIQSALLDLLNVVWPLGLIVISTVTLLSVAVSGFRMTAKPLTPDWEKASPWKGVKRIFSSKSVVRGVMAVIKVAIMTAIAYWIIQRSMGPIADAESQEIGLIVSSGWLIAIQIVIAIAAAMTAAGALDLLFQKWKHHQDLKMSRQEIKDEVKDTDGDPLLKARIKQIQREYASRKMMRDIPSATVVLTNPTHYAVALRYHQPDDDAPRVVAKGIDHLAQQIKIVARENDVPVLERKELARALYQSVEVGEEIPLELYQAVAEILAYVMEQRTILS